jgi:ATP-dependent DNA helicase DinG
MDLERARWIAKGRHTLELHCSPFDASDIARTHLWPKITRCILTSATLTSLGSFDAICHNIGLPPDTGKMILDSPLDYSRARLIVPKFAVDATDGNHPAMVKAYLHDFAIRAADHMGVLCYFTNRGLMIDAYESLSVEDRAVVLLQGEWTPSAMIAEHKRRIDLGQRSVLYGLDTLSEGVDLPGLYCTRVIVQRIPFPSPSDPILATHAEHLIAKGIEPFGRLTLPKAALKLAQVFGRLIRREGDHGEVMVLDRRLSTKKYGNQIVRSSQFARLEEV